MSTTPPPPPPPQNPYAASGAQPLRPEDEKLWSLLVHIGGIFFNFLPALIGYLVFKDRGPFVAAHTKTALNFQITLLIAIAVGVVTTLLIIGIFIIIAAYVVNIIFSIMAAVAANKGQYYTYPVAITFLK